MKKFLILFAAVLTATCALAAKKAPLINSIDPPYWWTGMANDTLQLFVYGNDVKNADLSVDYPGVKVASTAELDGSNDYKVVYLTIGKETVPGTVNLSFSKAKTTQKVPYELKKRTWKGNDNPGFDASDVLYLIMPDRFSDGNPANNNLPGATKEEGRFSQTADRTRPGARHGGDIEGMSNHLDYISDLGVTAIWVNPVLANDQPGGSYHGYATTDYYSIDPRFGSNDEWRDFVATAHSRGLKVVMDMIFNHCGSNHVWMKKFPASDWFNHQAEFENDGTVTYSNHRLFSIFDPYASDTDRDLTVNGWFTAGMPDLNQKNPHLMNYLIQNSIFWIEDSKIDGIRMDTYPYADMMEMARWSDAVEREYPNFNIVGECWYSNEAGSAFWQRGNRINPRDPALPTVMDFFFIQNGRTAFNSETDPWHGLNMVYDHLAQDFLYPDPSRILTFLDNHDSDRFLAELPDDLGRWKQAQAFLLTSRGIPQIYYGTELLMHGSKEGSDGYVRLDFPGGFPGDTTDAFTREGRTPLQNEAWDYLSHLLRWRRGEANDVIARGSLKHFMPQNGIYAYQRKLGDREIVVLMNGTDDTLDVTMERTVEVLPYGTVMTDIITGKPVTVEEEMTFAPRQVMILQNF